MSETLKERKGSPRERKRRTGAKPGGPKNILQKFRALGKDREIKIVQGTGDHFRRQRETFVRERRQPKKKISVLN